MTNHLKPEPCSLQRSGKIVDVINEKHGIRDVVCLTEFPQKLSG